VGHRRLARAPLFPLGKPATCNARCVAPAAFAAGERRTVQSVECRFAIVRDRRGVRVAQGIRRGIGTFSFRTMRAHAATTTCIDFARGARAIARSLLQLRRRESQPPAPTYAAPGSPGILVPRRFWDVRQAQASPNDDFARENAPACRFLLHPCGGDSLAAQASRRRPSHRHRPPPRRRSRPHPRRSNRTWAPAEARIFSSRVRPRGASGGAPAPRPSGARPPAAVHDA